MVVGTGGGVRQVGLEEDIMHEGLGLAARPVMGVMEPGYMPAGKQAIITGLRQLP